MRIVINDYSGHPFQVQLSRTLASRGHEVLHLHFAEFETPKADLVRRPDDPATFMVEAISIGRPFAKAHFVRRRFQEIEYGRLVAQRIGAWQPGVVVGCNNPLDAQNEIQKACRKTATPFVFWLQDIYSVAIDQFLRQRLSVVGGLIGAYYRGLERRLLRDSDAIVAITDDFLPILERWGIDKKRCTIIPNWAPLDAISPGVKDNGWARNAGIAGKTVVLYSGTLGLKHNPHLLVELAEALRARADTIVLVVSEGQGADLIRREAKAHGLSNLNVLPFQPFEVYGDVLASADILLAMIEPQAGIFSVPSKVLSYLCCGRPIVLAIPPDNLAARIVRESGAGQIVAAGDGWAMQQAVLRLLDDARLRSGMGERGRKYAERHFGIAAIATRFETILAEVAAKPGKVAT